MNAITLNVTITFANDADIDPVVYENIMLRALKDAAVHGNLNPRDESTYVEYIGVDDAEGRGTGHWHLVKPLEDSRAQARAAREEESKAYWRRLAEKQSDPNYTGLVLLIPPGALDN